jgi:hypothetical protein
MKSIDDAFLQLLLAVCGAGCPHEVNSVLTKQAEGDSGDQFLVELCSTVDGCTCACMTIKDPVVAALAGLLFAEVLGEVVLQSGTENRTRETRI